MAVNFVPLHDRILVKKAEEASTTKSGLLHIPESGKERPQEGEVIAVGPGRMSDTLGINLTLAVKVGDRVLFGKYSGTEIKIEFEEFLILREDEILGKLVS